MKQRIKISENHLKEIVNESVKHVLLEGQYDDNPIKKWVYWCFNFNPIEEWMGLFKGAPAQHFIEKFDRVNGDMNRFFVELDGRNQQILIDYVMNNY